MHSHTYTNNVVRHMQAQRWKDEEISHSANLLQNRAAFVVDIEWFFLWMVHLLIWDFTQYVFWDIQIWYSQSTVWHWYDDLFFYTASLLLNISKAVSSDGRNQDKLRPCWRIKQLKGQLLQCCYLTALRTGHKFYSPQKVCVQRCPAKRRPLALEDLTW